MSIATTIDEYDNHIKYGGHEYVEIAGLKWATMNIGATSVTDYGLYFQWGDANGYTSEQVDTNKAFVGANYKYCDGTSSNMIKYNPTDGLTTLELSDDGVNMKGGGLWRMPTTAEFETLGTAVNSAWTTDYQSSGVAGLVLTDKTDSSKVLFFPAAGYAYSGSMYSGSMYSVGSNGRYWASSLYSSNTILGHYMYFDRGYLNGHGDYGRYYGFTLRGVVGE